MEIDRSILEGMFKEVSKVLLEGVDQLTTLDSVFGDGDHGYTISKIAKTIDSSLDQWESQNIKNFLDEMGNTIMGVPGGAATPLWGTLISGLALPLAESDQALDATTLKAMLCAALEEMESVTAARVGDKTMMDVLTPAVQAAQEGKDIAEVLHLAARAAEEGVEETKKFVARYGRAKQYKDATIGTADAGAVSMSLLFKGLEAGYCQSV